MNHFDDSHADDLQPVVDMLRANRPEATPLELDTVKQRVRARGANGRRARSADLMKSRLAILSMLVAGMLASTTGVGLAIDGLGGNDASVAQYATPPTPTPTGSTTPPGGVLGEQQHHHHGGGNNNVTTPTTTHNTPAPLQPAAQVEAGTSSGQLPFTGYLAIPVLIGGVVLLTTGLVLRRRVAAGDKS
jgi:hypothetical protein